MSTRSPSSSPVFGNATRRTGSARTASSGLALDQILVLARLAWFLTLAAYLIISLIPTLGAWGMLEQSIAVPPKVMTLLRLVMLVGLGIIALELVVAALRLLLWSLSAPRMPGTLLRIRTPNPQTSVAKAGEAKPNGADLWYAAHGLLPAQDYGAMLPPWLAFTVSARPDEPVTFSAAVGGGTHKQHAQWVAALRQLIIGHNPEAVVETVPDELAQAFTAAQGRGVLGWAEYLLPYGPAYPLRVPDDADADLLGPLIAQIRPRAGAVRYAEAQIVVQPRHDWRMDDLGWRAAAHRRMQTLRARSNGLALAQDAKALEQKLDSPAANTLLRVVLVAENAASAHAMLAEVSAVLGQYAERSGHLLQRFVAVRTQACAVPSAHMPVLSIRLLGLSFGVGLLLALAALVLWPLPTAIAGVRPLLGFLVGLLPALLLSVHHRAQSGASVQDAAVRVRLRAPWFTPPQPILLPLPAWRRPAILSAGELGGLWHLPTRTLGTLARWLPCRNLPAPPHAFLPERRSVVAEEGNALKRIPLGYARRSDGRMALVGPTLRDLRQIMHVTAGMGAGKSRLLSNMAIALLEDGFTQIDGKGDDAGNLTTTTRRYLSLEDEARLVILDMADTDWPISLNPLDGIDPTRPGAIDIANAQIQSIFARLDPEGWSNAPGMQQFLDMGTRLVVETVEAPTVAHVKQALIDEGYRATLLARSQNTELKIFWEVIYPSSSEQQRTSMNALMRRFDKLLLSDLVRTLVVSEHSTFRFTHAIERKLIVLCPIPHVTYGPLAATAAMLIFQSFLRAAFERPGDAQTRREYPLMVDEFQVLVENGATQDVAAAVTQLRALGIPTLYAHQALTQIGELRDLLLINAENRVIMRNQEPDASLYARQYPAGGLSAADISGQEPTEHQYARFVVSGQTVGPCSIAPLAWQEPRTILLASASKLDWKMIIPATLPPRAKALNDQMVPELALICGATPEERVIAEEMAREYDAGLAEVIHAPFSAALAQHLAKTCSEEEWIVMQARCGAIQRAQRQFILDNPACIPDRMERQIWLSRLGFARPRLLAEIEFLRIRRAMETGATLQPRAGKKEKRASQRGGGGQSVASDTEPREHWTTNNQPPAPDDEDPKRVDPHVAA